MCAIEHTCFELLNSFEIPRWYMSKLSFLLWSDMCTICPEKTDRMKSLHKAGLWQKRVGLVSSKHCLCFKVFLTFSLWWRWRPNFSFIAQKMLSTDIEPLPASTLQIISWWVYFDDGVISNDGFCSTSFSSFSSLLVILLSFLRLKLYFCVFCEASLDDSSPLEVRSVFNSYSRLWHLLQWASGK